MKVENIQVIAFDADDTLWVNEPNFQEAEAGFKQILSNYVDVAALGAKLYETEKENLKLFGYGSKGFTLSMIETAIQLTEGKIEADEIHQIIQLGKTLMQKPIELLPHVRHVLDSLDEDYELMILTKGDLFEQESKIARSQLTSFFKYVEIVSEKHPQAYQEVLERNEIEKEAFVMIGNSLKSDVLPVVEMGAAAIHIPYATTWVHEQVSEKEKESMVYLQLDSIQEVLQVFPTPNRLS